MTHDAPTLRTEIDLDAMDPVRPGSQHAPDRVWHNVTVETLLNVMRSACPDVIVTALWHRVSGGERRMYVYASARSSVAYRSSPPIEEPLPIISDLLRDAWPSVADIFCAD